MRTSPEAVRTVTEPSAPARRRRRRTPSARGRRRRRASTSTSPEAVASSAEPPTTSEADVARRGVDRGVAVDGAARHVAAGGAHAQLGGVLDGDVARGRGDGHEPELAGELNVGRLDVDVDLRPRSARRHGRRAAGSCRTSPWRTGRSPRSCRRVARRASPRRARRRLCCPGWPGRTSTDVVRSCRPSSAVRTLRRPAAKRTDERGRSSGGERFHGLLLGGDGQRTQPVRRLPGRVVRVRSCGGCVVDSARRRPGGRGRATS